MHFDSELETGSNHSTATSAQRSYIATQCTSKLSLASTGSIIHDTTCETYGSSNVSSTKTMNRTVNYHVNKNADMMQFNDYNIIASRIMIRMMNNLRAKHFSQDNTRVILMRSGETMSEVFPDWTTKAFDDTRTYIPYDLNMPSVLRITERHDDLLLNPPLTNISAHFASRLGFTMTHNIPTLLYTAPETAVQETARQLMRGMRIDIKWQVEPGLVRYFSPNEPKPIFTASNRGEMIYTMENINSIIGNESFDEFQKRITMVVSKLQFPHEATTIVIADHCVIDTIIQVFVRDGIKLTKKQQLSLSKRIPHLSLMQFDITNNNKWKPSCASLPGLIGISSSMYNLPDVNFLIRPTCEF